MSAETKSVIELKKEAKGKGFHNYSKLKRAELCALLGYEKCGKKKRMSTKNGMKMKNNKKSVGKMSKTSNDFITDEIFMLNEKDFDFLVHYKGIMKLLHSEAKKVENKPEKYYFHNEFDSSVSLFEKLSNKRKLGVVAKSDKVAQILLLLLQMIYFDVADEKKGEGKMHYGLTYFAERIGNYCDSNELNPEDFTELDLPDFFREDDEFSVYDIKGKNLNKKDPNGNETAKKIQSAVKYDQERIEKYFQETYF